MSSQVLCLESVSTNVKNQFIIQKTLAELLNEKVAKILAQAFDCVEDEDYLTAIKFYDLALKEDPDNLGALIDKGVTLQNMGKLKLAIRCFDKALSISPENIDALLNKGTVLHSDEKYSDAIACYDAALKIDKKCAMALAYKGLSLGELGELHDAIRHFKKALSIDEHYYLASISKDIAQDLLNSIQEKSKTQ